MSLIDLIYPRRLEHWSEDAKKALEGLYGASQGAIQAVRLHDGAADAGRRPSFCGSLHPSNPDSGPYAGMSFVIFPVPDGPSLIAMGVGTQGLSPDEEILGGLVMAGKFRQSVLGSTVETAAMWPGQRKTRFGSISIYLETYVGNFNMTPPLGSTAGCSTVFSLQQTIARSLRMD